MDGPWAVASSLHLKSLEGRGGGGSGMAELARVSIVRFMSSGFVKICI